MYNFNLITGDIFDHIGTADVICITTNGTIKTNGELVMGAGIAKEFFDRYKHLNIAYRIARKIHNGPNLNTLHVVNKSDNIPYRVIKAEENGGVTHIMTFPTKMHFQEKGDLDLIISSAKRLKAVADYKGLKKIIIPSPGIGCGNLKKEDIYEKLSEILDNRFYIITK